uniref:Uncharacterized protein n=1 Tax=Candidatus Kentrum sp. FM TaxID=2126340 RepID=A0A450TWL6_9GAMM|nr:MAG: hypothetical protein BECKFM1743C_GA0114222_105501 [Candidatus Kentron sp. FM]VFJ73447.1 MAG: hypothetical protein BECKFM1743A_GA0114220_107191 [Candidatus Kentron sp. FM]VFK10558.1 MAG: hypothetical protein BECKFM1743B_GA0114221_101447 [Candidatus Kentron sp. FM]
MLVSFAQTASIDITGSQSMALFHMIDAVRPGGLTGILPASPAGYRELLCTTIRPLLVFRARFPAYDGTTKTQRREEEEFS